LNLNLFIQAGENLLLENAIKTGFLQQNQENKFNYFFRNSKIIFLAVFALRLFVSKINFKSTKFLPAFAKALRLSLRFLKLLSEVKTFCFKILTINTLERSSL
jgi:hypothetical protein